MPSDALMQEEPQTRPPFSDDEAAAALELHEWVSRIPDFLRMAERAAAITPLKYSPLADDDEVTTPNHSSHYLSLLFQHAGDYLRAIERLCEPQEESITIPLVSLNPLLRAVLEDGALALWLLHPEDRKERVRRLQVMRDDELSYEVRSAHDYVARSRSNGHHARGQLEKVLRDVNAMKRRKRAEMRAVAEAVGLTDDDYVNRMPAWVELIDQSKENTAFAESALPTAIWSAASGLSHFSHARAMVFLDREVLGEGKGDGVLLARTTANVPMTTNFLMVAMGMYSAAGDRLKARKTPAMTG